MFEARQAELLLQVTRDASTGGTFERRLEAIAASLEALIPSMAVTAIVVRRELDGPPAAPRAFVRGLDPADVAAYAEHYVQHDPCPGAARARPGEPITLSDLVSGQRFGRDPYTGELLLRHGIRHVIGCLVPVPDGWLSLGLHRERGRPDFSRRERDIVRLLAPDLARAAFGSLLAEKVAGAARAVDAHEPDAGGAMLFDAHGDLVHAEPAALALARRLSAGDELPPDELFDDVRRLLAPGTPVGTTRERALLAPDGAAFVARSTLVEMAPERCVLTTVACVDAAAWRREALARRWGLTARELDVARLAAEGRSNASIAERLRLSPATVAVHLGRVFRKAGVSGRGELIRALGAP